MDDQSKLQEALQQQELLNKQLSERLEDALASAREKDELIQALNEIRAGLEMAVSSARLGTWDWNKATGVLSWSDSCRLIFGFSPDSSITFEIFAEHIHPDDRKWVIEDIQHQANTQDACPYDVVFRITRADDLAVRWIRVRGQAYNDGSSLPERFIGTALDITESKLAQEKIAQSEKLFKSIALNLPKSVIIVIDTEQRFMLIEGDMMQRMGYESKDYVGKYVAEVSPRERYEASKELYGRVLGGEKFSVERKAPSGEDYLIHFTPLKQDDGSVYAGLIVALDISYLKLAEEKSAKLAAIIDSSDDAIVSKSLEGIVTSWNDSAKRIFGYSEDEMIGQPILKLIPPDRQEEEPRILSRLRNGERVEHFETRRVTKSGDLIDVSLTISPVRDSEGRIIGLSKIARDITSRKQEEQRKADFISMVSHELKTPLTSITAYIQVLLAKAKGEDDQFSSDALGKTEIQLRKMNAMISDFLSMARIDEGKMQLHKATFDLQPLVREVAEDAQFLTTRHKINIVSDGPVSVFADREKMSLVLVNLVSNAVKYSPQGGTITITTERRGHQVFIAIKDEGIGISTANQERLFERFFRVSNDMIKNVSGFGIGLYLAAEILGYHNSKMSVESAEGKGSVFSFLLEIA